MPKAIYLVTGVMAPAVARALARRLERGVHLAGEVSPDRVDAEFAAGSSVVVEASLPGRRLGDFRTAIRGRPCHQVVLGELGQTGHRIDVAGLSPEEVVDAILARTVSVAAPLVVVDYDPAWPAAFEALARPVRAALAGIPAAVEHVGSTAVPGLAAKPIIDIDVVVSGQGHVAPAIDALLRLGYVHQGDKGIPGREAFLWPPGAPIHHLYVVVRGEPPHADHVDFRDFLRGHPDVAREYAVLKRELAARHRDDRLGYTEAKDDFIGTVLLRARGS